MLNNNTEAHLTEVESYFVLHNIPFDSIQINHLPNRNRN